MFSTKTGSSSGFNSSSGFDAMAEMFMATSTIPEAGKSVLVEFS